MKDGKPSREEQYDVLKINVPVEKTDKEVEQFTIRFEEDPSLKLIMEWDYTRVSLEFD